MANYIACEGEANTRELAGSSRQLKPPATLEYLMKLEAVRVATQDMANAEALTTNFPLIEIEECDQVVLEEGDECLILHPHGYVMAGRVVSL